MNKLFYPAIFHKAEEGGFWVTFPDIPECLTEGNNMDEAYEMSVDALGLSITSMLEQGDTIPPATSPDAVVTDDDGCLILIEFDMAAYKKKHCSKAVKKTLSIPEWLNEEALAHNINFSQVLQRALIAELEAIK